MSSKKTSKPKEPGGKEPTELDSHRSTAKTFPPDKDDLEGFTSAPATDLPDSKSGERSADGASKPGYKDDQLFGDTSTVWNKADIETEPSYTPYTDEQRKEWAAARGRHFRTIGRSVVPRILGQGPKPDIYWDQVDYLAIGAVPQPPDGDNVIANGREEQCLTCIKQERTCFGTSVKDGKCENCRRMRGRSASRACAWIDLSNDIWTYPEAQGPAGGRRLPKNTRSEIAKRTPSARTAGGRKKSSIPQDDKAAKSVEEDRSLAPAAEQTSPRKYELTRPAKRFLQDAAQKMIEENTVSEDPLSNVKGLFAIIAEQNHIRGKASKFGKRYLNSVIPQMDVLRSLGMIAEAGKGLDSAMITYYIQNGVSKWELIV